MSCLVSDSFTDIFQFPHNIWLWIDPGEESENNIQIKGDSYAIDDLTFRFKEKRVHVKLFVHSCISMNCVLGICHFILRTLIAFC